MSVKLVTQTLGAVTFGLGVVITAAAAKATPAARETFAGALAAVHGVAALALWVNMTQYPTAFGWATLAASLFFATTYLCFWIYCNAFGPGPAGQAPLTERV